MIKYYGYLIEVFNYVELRIVFIIEFLLIMFIFNDDFIIEQILKLIFKIIFEFYIIKKQIVFVIINFEEFEQNFVLKIMMYF